MVLRHAWRQFAGYAGPTRAEELGEKEIGVMSDPHRFVGIAGEETKAGRFFTQPANPGNWGLALALGLLRLGRPRTEPELTPRRAALAASFGPRDRGAKKKVRYYRMLWGRRDPGNLAGQGGNQEPDTKR